MTATPDDDQAVDEPDDHDPSTIPGAWVEFEPPPPPRPIELG